MKRRYPVIKEKRPSSKPLSFIVVRYSNSYDHNIARSECIYFKNNQLIVVDNRYNLFFDNLSSAFNYGLDQAENDLVVAVHEDVLLPEGWQSCFEQSLNRLEEFDKSWGLLGSVGWKSNGSMVGFYSDPHHYLNNMKKNFFIEVSRTDEQIMVFRKSSGYRFDEKLPSIHNIARDLSLFYRERDQKTYVIQAPTIHKYADENGRLIKKKKASKAIMNRDSKTYLAEHRLSKEYFDFKVSQKTKRAYKNQHTGLSDIAPHFSSPIILLSRGGSGSRLLSTLVRDLGVFLGDKLNPSGDSLQMTEAIYIGILSKYRGKSGYEKSNILPRIIEAASIIHESPGCGDKWGFKLPETLFLLEEMDKIFPGAIYIHLIRDPLHTCIRRTHMTARLDNSVGRVCLPLAYKFVGRDVEKILTDSPAFHMAYTTIHQILTTRKFGRLKPKDRYIELRFEDIITSPKQTKESIGEWLHAETLQENLENTIDKDRSVNITRLYSREVEEKTESVLRDLRKDLGYIK